MTCPDLETLERHLSDEVDSLTAHVEGCPLCRARISELRDHASLGRELRGCGELVVGTPGLEGYELVREVGRGGMGIVYEALHLATNRRVAVKMLSNRRAAGSRSGRRFAREIELVADMRHANIVTVYDSGTTAEGNLYFAMELVHGCDLRTWVSRLGGKARSPTELLELFCRICEPIVYAHQRGVIHRDLTPSNILIDDVGEPRLVDFGLAKEFRSSPSAGGLTLSGEFMGSLAWAAPEQVGGSAEALDVRLDVHALGLILNWLLCGESTYRVDGSMAEAVRSILHDRPLPPSKRGNAGRYGADLDAIVLKALEKDVSERYPSVETLLADCRNLLAGRAIEARRPTGLYRVRKAARRHPWAAAGLAMLFASVPVVLVSSRRSAERHAFEQSQSRVTEARLESAQGNTVRAEQLLWREFFFPPGSPSSPEQPGSGLPVELRRTLWGLFELYARDPCVNTMELGQPIKTLALANDQLALAISGTDRVDLYTIPELELSESLSHDAQVDSVEYSPDGRWIATCAGEELYLWSRSAPARLSKLSGTVGAILDSTFDADGRWLVAICEGDRSAYRWSVENGRRDATWHLPLPPDFEAHAVGWLSSGDTWAVTQSGKRRQEVCLYSSEGVLRDRFELEGHYAAWRTSADGHFLHTAQYSTRPQVVDMRDASAHVLLPLAVVAQHGRNHTRMAPKQPVLACTGGPNESVELRGILHPRVRTLQGHSIQALPLEFSTDGHYLATGDRSGLLRLWYTRELTRALAREPAEDRSVEALAFLPDSRLVAAAGEGPIRVWSADSGTLAYEWPLSLFQGDAQDPPVRGFWTLAFHPKGGGRVVAGTMSGSVFSWQLEDAPTPALLRRRAGAPCGAAFDRSGERLALGWQDHVTVLDTDSDRVVLDQEIEAGRMRALAWSADGRSLLGAGSIDVRRPHRGFLLQLDLDGGSKRSEERPRPIRCIASHAARALWVIADDDGQISYQQHGSSDWIPLEPRHDASVYALAFGSDGSLLATGDRLGQVKIWDTDSWEELAELDAYPEPIFELDFATDAPVLAVSGVGQDVVFWDFREVFERVARNLAYQRGQQDRDERSATGRNALRWIDLALER